MKMMNKVIMYLISAYNKNVIMMDEIMAIKNVSL
jgi:hypothetical protein